jgi:hypothetical protein
LSATNRVQLAIAAFRAGLVECRCRARLAVAVLLW